MVSPTEQNKPRMDETEAAEPGSPGMGGEPRRVTFRVWRGDAKGGDFETYETEVSEGMVVLDALHQIQAQQAGDLAIRWNCKAGKCGSCSVEINGKPRLMCMTRMDELSLDRPVTLEPMPPNERRIIHLTLRSHPDVCTESSR